MAKDVAKKRQHFLVYFVSLTLFASPPALGHAEENTSRAKRSWALSFYWGNVIDGTVLDAFSFDHAPLDAQLVALALSKSLLRHQDWFEVGAEAQVVKYIRQQSHFEFNGLGTLHWLSFSWKRFLGTKLGLGWGLSYATEKPETELEKNGKASKLMFYLMYEGAVFLNDTPQREVFARLHHRSGGFGTIDEFGVR